MPDSLVISKHLVDLALDHVRTPNEIVTEFQQVLFEIKDAPDARFARELAAYATEQLELVRGTMRRLFEVVQYIDHVELEIETALARFRGVDHSE